MGISIGGSDQKSSSDWSQNSSSSSDSQSSSSSSSRPSSPQDLTQYYQTVNALTHGGLTDLASGNSPTAVYPGLDIESVIAPLDEAMSSVEDLYGENAMRVTQLDQQRDEQIAEVMADPTSTAYQKQRASQLINEDVDAEIDAALKETEAAIADATIGLGTSESEIRANLEAENALRSLQESETNANLTREDIELLANIYYGGMGTFSNSFSQSTSTSQSESSGSGTSTGDGSSWNFGVTPTK